jgi:lon-related putative ATP-dependent protease
MQMKETYELAISELRCACDPAQFKFKSTAEIKPLDEVIGQERAVQSIDFGLNMKSPGYNIFVTGLEGTGKSTIVRDITEKHAQMLSTPNDWCMVNNFQDGYRPKSLAVPSGKAGILSKQMNRLVNTLHKKLPKAFENDSFQEKNRQIQEKYQKQEMSLFQKLDADAKARNLVINKTTAGFQTIPVKEGKPLTPEEYGNLEKEEQAKIEAEVQALQSEIESTLRESHKIRQAKGAETEKFVEEITLFVVKGQMAFIRESYHDCPEILVYLDEVQADIVENVESFLPTASASEKAKELLFPEPEPSFNKYKVNVLVDHHQTKGAPVIFEPNPTYQNVFGRIEKKAHMGGMTTDFTMVQAGSLLQAGGGILIMEIESLLMNPFVWESLKRTLQNKMLFIEDMGAGQGFAVSSLRPEPIPIDVTVILLGGYEPFQVLQNYDSKFNKIFKVRADFDHEVESNDRRIQQYAQFVARVCKQEDLLPFSPDGMAALVEFGGKYTSTKNKLSLRFGAIVGIIKEADYWAKKDQAALVSSQYVIKAFNEHRFRYNLYEEKIHESYADETILIDVAGGVVGQVNGLAVYQMGDISFGRPSRITAETYMGKQGVVNVEREAKLSGNTHDKGVLILSGYIGRTFAQQQPLSLSISLTFEQSYHGVDGDSASSTELYAILSSLSGFPIDQGIAVTGSVNQKGKVQAIGGANQKIEGFYAVCKTKGLTGKQGVMIPKANVKNLMLKKEVLDAVERGKFHVYQVSSVEEGIQILTGKPVGTPDKNGRYPSGTVYGNVQKKLKKYHDQAMKFSNVQRI